MIWAEFYRKSVISDEFIPACGDRAALILDGRERFESRFTYCKAWAAKHGFVGFRLMRGDSFMRSNPESHIYSA